MVPVYNVEEFLETCLDSLLAQTFTDFEAILVDDGSTDHSAEIAHRYAERDSRFRIVTQENGGLSKARNTGADAANGEFLVFLDSDDALPPNAYELLVGALDETGSDFATGNVHRLTRFATFQSPFLAKTFPETRLKTHVTKFRPLLADRPAWNKLWRRSFWDANGFRFPEGRRTRTRRSPSRRTSWPAPSTSSPSRSTCGGSARAPARSLSASSSRAA